jgi:hypothetical protein
MSLKAFHLVFVTLISSLALGCGIWQFVNYRSPGGTTANLLIAIGSLLVVVGMLVYGHYFLKKLKNVSYL